jgi:hypothetical protein
MFGEHLPDHRQPAVERLDDGVDLDAVARGQHHRLGDERGLQYLIDDLGLIGLIGAQLLEDRHRRASVGNPEKQNAHGSITTSSTVAAKQLGDQIPVPAETASQQASSHRFARSARNLGSSISQ